MTTDRAIEALSAIRAYIQDVEHWDHENGLWVQSRPIADLIDESGVLCTQRVGLMETCTRPAGHPGEHSAPS